MTFHVGVMEIGVQRFIGGSDGDTLRNGLPSGAHDAVSWGGNAIVTGPRSSKTASGMRRSVQSGFKSALNSVTRSTWVEEKGVF